MTIAKAEAALGWAEQAEKAAGGTDPDWTTLPGTFDVRASCPEHPHVPMRRCGEIARCSECGDAVAICDAIRGWKHCVREKGHPPDLHVSPSGSAWPVDPAPSRGAISPDPVGAANAKTLGFLYTRIARDPNVAPEFREALPAASVLLEDQPTEELYRIERARSLALTEAGVEWDRVRACLSASLHEVQAVIMERVGDEASATWHRLQSRALRTRDPKDAARADEAWLHSMAVSYLRRGAMPEPGSHRAADIVAAMNRIKEGV